MSNEKKMAEIMLKDVRDHGIAASNVKDGFVVLLSESKLRGLLAELQTTKLDYAIIHVKMDELSDEYDDIKITSKGGAA